MAILAGAQQPEGGARLHRVPAVRARAEGRHGARVFPITPKYKVQGAPGSTAELAVEFTGGVRSYFDREVTNVYDEAVAAKRYDAVKVQFRKDIEAKWEELKKK